MTSPSNCPHRHGIRVNQASLSFRAPSTTRIRLPQLREALRRRAHAARQHRSVILLGLRRSAHTKQRRPLSPVSRPSFRLTYTHSQLDALTLLATRFTGSCCLPGRDEKEKGTAIAWRCSDSPQSPEAQGLIGQGAIKPSHHAPTHGQGAPSRSNKTEPVRRSAR